MNKEWIEQELGKDFLDLMSEPRNSVIVTGVHVPDPTSLSEDWIKNCTISSLDIIKVLAEVVGVLSVEAKAAMANPIIAGFMTTLYSIAFNTARSGKMYMDLHGLKFPDARKLKKETIEQALQSIEMTLETRNHLELELQKLTQEIDGIEVVQSEDEILVSEDASLN